MAPVADDLFTHIALVATSKEAKLGLHAEEADLEKDERAD